jgi:hypothetical protein
MRDHLEFLSRCRKLLPGEVGRVAIPSLPFFAFALSITLVSVSPAEGQLRFVPSVGAYAPLSDLGEVRDQEGGTFMEAGKRVSTLAFGGGVELGPIRGLANLRAEAAYATASNVPIRSMECPECGLRSTLLVGSASLVLRPFMDLMVAQPYLVLGGGVKRYDFDPREMTGLGAGDYFRDQTRPSFHLGGGVQFHLGALRPRLELSAHFSRFEPGREDPGVQGSDDRQNSLFLMFGLPMGGG